MTSAGPGTLGQLDGPRDVHRAGAGRLVVVCQGRTVYSPDWSEILEYTPGQVVFVNTTADTVLDRIELPGQAAGASGTQASVVVLEQGVAFVLDSALDRILEIGLDSRHGAVVTPDWGDTGTGLSGLAYDPAKQQLLVGRLARGAGGVPGFAAAGHVISLDADGLAVATFTAGPAPSHLVLLH